MSHWSALRGSPRAWVYAAIGIALPLAGVDLEITWEAFSGPFVPQRLALVVIPCAVMSVALNRWLMQQFNQRRQKQRFVLPFTIGFAVLPVAGVAAHAYATSHRMNGFEEAGEIILEMFALVASVVLGVAVCGWTLAIVHTVGSAESSRANDGPQLVSAVIAAGLLGLGTLFSAFHLLLLDFAGRMPEFGALSVIWCVWGAVWFAALVWLAVISRSRDKERRWLARVKEGHDCDYAIESLSEHPEWADLPPYLTARSYSGVLVYEPEDQSEPRELLGRVE